MGPSRVHKGGEATLVKGNLVRNFWGIFSTFTWMCPILNVSETTKRGKNLQGWALCEALGMEMCLPWLCEHSIAHSLPSVTPWVC